MRGTVGDTPTLNIIPPLGGAELVETVRGIVGDTPAPEMLSPLGRAKMISTGMSDTSKILPEIKHLTPQYYMLNFVPFSFFFFFVGLSFACLSSVLLLFFLFFFLGISFVFKMFFLFFFLGGSFVSKKDGDLTMSCSRSYLPASPYRICSCNMFSMIFKVCV